MWAVRVRHRRGRRPPGDPLQGRPRQGAGVHIRRGPGRGGRDVLGPGVRSNRIEVKVTVDPSRATEATSAFLNALYSYGDLVHVTGSTDVPPRWQGGVVVGGEKWLVGTEYVCSIGFSVTRPDKSKAFLTAGHCTTDAGLPAYDKDRNRLGTSNKGGNNINGSEGDMGLVDVDQTGWDLSAKVSGWGAKPDFTVIGSGDAVVGTAICRSGATTGLRCGEVTKADRSVLYGTKTVDGLFLVQRVFRGR
ncbi:S1 family peptidase [Streptomyces litmocidini]|uniref:S1 family peptidase n=1 Tax=Streptomyces litmocidini TaxID=67318 RepID=UPI0033DACAF5